MPSPNIMAAALARRTSKRDAARPRQLDRALQPADPRRRGVRDARRDLRRAAHRRLPGRHVDGHELLLRRRTRRRCATKYREAHDLIIKAWTEREPFAWNGKYTQAPLREPLAAADPEAAPADLGAGPRLDRDLGLLRRPRLQLQLPLVQRLQARAEDDGRLLGARARSAARRDNPLPRRVLPAGLRQRHATRRARSEWWPHVDYFFNKCLHLYPGHVGRAGLHERGVAARRHRRAGRQHVAEHGHEQDVEGALRGALHRRRLARDRAPAARGAGEVAPRRAPRGRRSTSARRRSSSRTAASYLFATQVMPHLRPLFAEYEDICWPKPLPATSARRPARRRAAVRRAGRARSVGAAA